MSTRVLMVLADAPEADQLDRLLRAEGFDVRGASTGDEALAIAHREEAELIVLGARIPDFATGELCHRIRTLPGNQSVAVMWLGAGNEVLDRIEALELGADDYLGQPWPERELVLRLRALARRVHRRNEGRREQHGLIEIDRAGQRVRVHGERLRLSATEYLLLLGLAERPGTVRTPAMLIAELGAVATPESVSSLTTQMRRLRAKLGPAGSQIQTVRGLGYRLDPTPP